MALLATLAASASASIPVHSCTNYAVGLTVSCTIATVSPNHALLTFIKFGSGALSTLTITYSDTLGNTGTALASCSPSGTPCVGPFAVYARGAPWGLSKIALFALSSGSTSGPITFSYSINDTQNRQLYIFTAEYAEDYAGVDVVNIGGSAGLTTTGSNDLIVVQGDAFFGSFNAPAGGFTMEFNNTAGAMSDKIDAPAGTYNVAMSTSGNTFQAAAALGVTSSPPPPPPPPPPPAPSDQFVYVRGVWVFDQGSPSGGGTTGGGGVTTPLEVTTVSPLPTAAQNSFYRIQLEAAGGIPPYNWSGDAPPTGLSLDSYGQLSGTPTGTGTFSFGVEAHDSVATTASKSLSLTVLVPGAHVALLHWNGGGGVSYNVKRSTTNGGPYTTIATGIALACIPYTMGGSTYCSYAAFDGLSYTDANVASGITYYYVVSAVNSKGESPNSAQASASIP